MKTRSAWKSKRRWAIGLADGTDIDGDDTVCVEVGAALGKLDNALDGDTVSGRGCGLVLPLHVRKII